ncbi:MAG TPA: metallophosphoesterase [Polyangiaceae bacterium]
MPRLLNRRVASLLFVLPLACEGRGSCSGSGRSSDAATNATPLLASGAAPETLPAASALLAAGGPDSPGGFAIIGDYGAAAEHAGPVAELVKSQRPDFVITLGDNNYPAGSAETIDQNIGRFYSEFIYPYAGRYGKGARENRFFPSLGNHDWYAADARPYLDYFTLPGNERYYDFVRGDVHFFAVDSDPNEPDGIEANSVQAAWLQRGLAASKSAWQVVYMHHPPFSSGRHGSTPELQWPYAQWGADLVLAGHDHHYENLFIGGVTYLINGLGGRQAYPIGRALPGSRVRYNAKQGAQFALATDKELRVRFVSVDRRVVDDVVLKKP